MPYSKKAMFSWKSAVVGSLKGSPAINTKTSKHQNFPGGGVGARSHIGRGLGLHYHADGKSASPNHLNLYNSKDYVGHYHPPLIGFGFDGIALYGQYDANFPQMHGYSTALDEFGGHFHGNYGYHYHAHVVKSNNLTGLVNNTSGVNGLTNNPALVYDVHILMKGAWAGKINSIPEFWDGPTPNYTIGRNNNSTFVGF